ncbi:MAG: PEP-CTERM system histidine kinase PrsK [bacterium]|nr:PEP-CTERM system histidine kinase PrsK [bacterium]MDT8366735.1 PEP-CTERM system histidine kinase PrsK [bacterium]
MNFDTYIHFSASVICGVLAYIIIMRHPRSVVHRVLTFTVLIFSLESLFCGLSVREAMPDKVIFWQYWRWGVAAMLPGSLTAFVLLFGHGDPRAQLRKYRGGILTAFFLYPALLTPFFGPFFMEPVVRNSSGGLLLPLGGPGYIFMIIFVLGLVPAMALLERILRTSRGIYRWQIKFLVLGIVSYLGARVFTASLSILFRSVDLNMETLNSGALIVAAIFLIGSFVRTRVLPTEIYISPRVILGSITLTLVGLYLLAIGIIAQVAVSTGSNLPLEALAFLIFLAFLGFSMLFLSDRIRQTLKKFISRNFQRPLYDYRHIWEVFTQRISPIMDARILCGEAAKLISETMEILSVNILLADESDGRWYLFGSTAHSETSSADLAHVHKALDLISERVVGRGAIIDVQGRSTADISFLSEEQIQSLGKLRMRYFLSLRTGKTSLGLLALDEKVRYLDLTIEEEDLSRTLAGHLAGSIQNVRLSEQLQISREMETLRKFSAFFVHDLKNLASKLSMMLQNFPDNYDNPDFRKDALNLISQSVDKINLMTHRVSQLREEPEVSSETGDLTKVVQRSVSEFDFPPGISIMEEYGDCSLASFDGDQISKVVTNLVLNAVESISGVGTVCVKTFEENGWAIIEATDDGSGMDDQFIAHSLFRPFKTTKGSGLGIGLYQCRIIVEAHGGRISVSSRPGKGSTFKVFLPVTDEAGGG